MKRKQIGSTEFACLQTEIIAKSSALIANHGRA
jgi:hypothetical protein